jgi:UDP-N-acetylglucosamine--N-acetylmuramyl-(pentapeptide) pyrophosphoryl-undecaprenol N-acetylglucosamine transferase
MSKKVLIMAGGTGGHIFPAIMIVKLLQNKSVEVAWLGTYRGLENKIVPKHDIYLYRISIAGLRGKSFWSLLGAPLRILYAFFQAVRIIFSYQPDVVLGMGGFASGPGGLAAWVLRKKLIVHEQNAVIGFTNRILSHFADAVFTGFPKAMIKGKLKQYRYAGIPVRREIMNVTVPDERFKGRSGAIRILVLGGSQGALSFNSVIPQALAQLKDREFAIRHQSGERYFELACSEYKKAELSARVEAFIDEIYSAYEWADLVISRAGASTVAELSAVGIASILVPFPYAVDDHQTVNARYLEKTNAAVLLPQDSFNPEQLSKTLLALTANRDKLLAMAEQARTLRKEDSAELILQELLND